MSVSGEPDGPPVRMGVPIVDTYAGTLAALAINAALVQRERTGEGQKIDVAMFDAALVALIGSATQYLVKGEVPVRTGNTGFSAQPTAGLFRCSDGELISLGVVQQNQYEQLCRVLRRQDLLTDHRFVVVKARRAHSRQLTAILEDVFLTRASEDWERELSAVGCPCGVVRDVGAALELEQVRHRGLRLPVTIPGLPEEQVDILNAGFVFEHDGPGMNEPPPRLGEHTDEVLRSLEAKRA
jgi:crotonobetainyl-CoA:carnitine CoA-transferase CaiB-like acyl-CoA transferase